MSRTLTFTSHELTAERAAEFAARGHRPASFFPHSLRFLPKAGPDGYLLAQRMVAGPDPSAQWEIVLHADASAVDGLPRDLFFDDGVVWHQQQFGLPGQIASANVVLDREELWSTGHVSDVVQRIGRRRALKTIVEKRFHGWHDMLLNGLVALAAERGVRRVYLPRSPLALANTDRKRWSKPELYERIYDRDVNRIYDVEAAGDWWLLDVAANRDRLIMPRVKRTTKSRGRIVCVCHDLERGLGHTVDEQLSREADRTWRHSLAEMLRIERARSVRATYNVVGCLLTEARDEISDGGHCLGFHSFDHRIDEAGQLDRCREVDYRLKGYRAPNSRITPELTDGNLLFHNFEWLAAAPGPLGASEPVLRDGLVRVPVDFDDFDLYDQSLGFDAWQARALARLESADVTVFSLHDCYADRWLPFYDEFLARVSSLGELWTVDELAADVTLAAAE